MTMPTPLGDPIPATLRRYRAAMLAVGLLVLAVSLIGVWFSLPPASAPILSAGATTAAPRLVADVEFEGAKGRTYALADSSGKIVLLNLWAT